MLQKNISKALRGEQSVKEVSNKKKNYIPSYSPEFENLSLCSIAQRVSMLCAFVYNVVDINKIVTVPLTKPPPYMNVQLT